VPARYWPRTTSRATDLRREGAQRLQHLELLVADGIGVARGRRLHRDHGQQLQRVVLDHVAQRAGLVVEVAARAHADALGQRDLDVGDALRRHSGSNRALPKRSAMRFCTAGLPR
jgi:very-short-patch-repair endonuclease